MVKGVLLWFALINIIGYVVMSEDKNKARTRRERVPEKTLFCWHLWAVRWVC